MSSKKAHRKKRREQEQAKRGKRVSPVTLFILGTVALIVLMVVGAMLFGDPSTGPPGDPPWPGAEWSPSHGHWH